MSTPEEHSLRPSEATAGSRSGWISGPWIDGVCIVGAPALALALGALAATEPLSMRRDWLPGGGSLASAFIGTFIFAHLILVGVRSHLNPSVFLRTPVRFTVVPLALFFALWLSPVLAVGAAVLATWWDVVHSSMQTFGLGRIYDARVGNDPHVGRRLDMGLNLVIYMGPILSGATLWGHLEDDWDDFGAHGLVALVEVPGFVMRFEEPLAIGVITLGLGYICFYLWAMQRLVRAGRRVSPQKVVLLVSTALVSLWAWGFNAFGEAFFIANFFHALQYFAIVWITEGGRLSRVVPTARIGWAKGLVFFGMIGLAGAFGFWADQLADARGPTYALLLVVSLMHFWYDGFIWSVRRRDV